MLSYSSTLHYAEVLGTRLARSLEEMNPTPINVVVAPAMGGIIIGHEVARALKARSIFTERDSSGKMTLRRGFHVEPGETAVVIEDVITTGGSSREVCDLLRELGVEVAAAGIHHRPQRRACRPRRSAGRIVEHESDCLRPL